MFRHPFAAPHRLAVPFGLVAALAAPAGARMPDDPGIAAALRRCEWLVSAGRADDGIRVLDSLRAARGPRDRNLELEIFKRRAAAYGFSGRPAESERAARSALTLAETLDDSVSTRAALRWLAYSYMTRTRLDESSPLYERLLVLARAAGDARNEGFAETGLAYRDLLAGRPERARDGYRRAVACFRRSGDTGFQLFPLVGLARVEGDLGDYTAARRSYESIVSLARAQGNLESEADATNNLGTLEYAVGDPTVAVEHWNRAAPLYRRIHARASLHTTLINIAIAEAALEHFAAAADTLGQVLADSRALGDLRGQAEALVDLAEIRRAQDRPAEAARLMHECLALGGLIPDLRSEALTTLASALSAMGRDDEALGVLLRDAEPLAPHLSAWRRIRQDLRVAYQFLAVGRAAEARDRFAGVARRAATLGLLLDEVDALTGQGRAELALAHPDSARSVLRRAASRWEAERRVPSRPEWRVRRGELAQTLCFELARATLAAPGPRGERVRECYDQMRRFKARTLLERMHGPAAALGDAGGEVTLAELQSRVLAPDELLLDAFVGRGDALLFAVTCDSLRLLPVGGADSLDRMVRIYRDLLFAAPTPEDAGALAALRTRAARRLSDLLLAPAADLLSRCHRVIVAPDGPLNVIGLGELPVPSGVADAVTAHGSTAPCVLDRWELCRVPSATLLAVLRAHPASPTLGAGHTVLAVAGDTDALGHTLPGGDREVRALTAALQGVDAYTHGRAPLDEKVLDSYEVLHLAGHVVTDDQRPWNSGVLLGGAAGAAARGTTLLTAATIASMRLRTRMAVLAGCESGGGHVSWGEGVEGLSAAFLVAGVPSVVVTLWPVDDAVSAALMREFYRALSDGSTVGEALRHAQRSIARRAGTRQPTHWAGYVLVGEAGARIALRRKFTPAMGLLALGLAVSAIALGGGGWWMWSRRRARDRSFVTAGVISPPAEPPYR